MLTVPPPGVQDGHDDDAARDRPNVPDGDDGDAGITEQWLQTAFAQPIRPTMRVPHISEPLDFKEITSWIATYRGALSVSGSVCPRSVCVCARTRLP